MIQQNDMVSERERVVALIRYYGRNHGALMRSLELAVENGAYIHDGKYHCGCGQLIEFGGPQHVCGGHGERNADLHGFLTAFQEFGPDCAQLLDGWHQDGTAWSEWDESVRKKLSQLIVWAEAF